MVIIPAPGVIIPAPGVIIPVPGVIIPAPGVVIPAPGVVIPAPGVVILTEITKKPLTSNFHNTASDDKPVNQLTVLLS